MTTLTAEPQSLTAGTGPPLLLEPRHWLAALAILFVFFAPYQTLVQTVITDDAVRLGIEADEYDMIWVTGRLRRRRASTACSRGSGCRPGSGCATPSSWGCLCSPSATSSVARRSGSSSLALGRFVEGFGKMVAMAICRATLYKQFDRALLVAIGFYGVFAYSTRHVDSAGQGVPRRVAVLAVDVLGLRAGRRLSAAVLVWRFIRPDRPPQPVHLPIDWLAVTVFVAWVVAIVFAFAWYRKWGGWSSNAFVATVVPLRRPARGPGRLARLGLQPRRAPEAAAAARGSTSSA